MAPGPPNLGDNRFALLASSPKPKRKKASYKPFDYPELPSLKQHNPKFITISSADPTKPLSKYSCFAVHKSLEVISKEISSISELRDGNLLLLVKSPLIAQKFLAIKKLNGICDVKVSLHENLNYSKGTIYAPCLNDVADEEIVDNLREQGVVAVYKFKKNINSKLVPTGVVLLTFDLYKLPEKVEVSWRTALVKPYFPNPMRCKSCQLLGHTIKRCNNKAACVTCNLPPHGPENCSRTLCANCAGEHPSSSNTCPRYIQAKEILKIKTENKCSMREAIKIQKSLAPTLPNTSFAQTLKNSEQECVNKHYSSSYAKSTSNSELTCEQVSLSSSAINSNSCSLNNNLLPQVPRSFDSTSFNIPNNSISLNSSIHSQTTSSLDSTCNKSNKSIIMYSNPPLTDATPLNELQSQPSLTLNSTLNDLQNHSTSNQKHS